MSYFLINCYSTIYSRTVLIVIDFSTDHLPIGEIRKLWNPEALVQKDKEIAKWEDSYRTRAREACERLMKKVSASIEEANSVNL